MTIRWNETVSLNWAERGKVHGQLMPIGEAVDLFATFSLGGPVAGRPKADDRRVHASAVLAALD